MKPHRNFFSELGAILFVFMLYFTDYFLIYGESFQCDDIQTECDVALVPGGACARACVYKDLLCYLPIELINEEVSIKTVVCLSKSWQIKFKFKDKFNYY